MTLDSNSLMSVTGKPASVSFGQIMPSFFGETELTLTSDSIIEKTKKIVSARESRLLLKSIDSAEISTKENPLLLLIGSLTLGLWGLGILFFILYFFFKHKCLIIYSNSNAQVVCIKGMEDEYKAFYEAVLAATLYKTSSISLSS